MSNDKRGKPLDFIIPKNDCVYLYMDLRGQKSSIIVTPEVSQQISETGVIVAKGPEVSDEFNVGDTVMVSYYTKIHIQLKENYAKSQYHRIIREHEILAVIDRDKREKFNKEE